MIVTKIAKNVRLIKTGNKNNCVLFIGPAEAARSLFKTWPGALETIQENNSAGVEAKAPKKRGAPYGNTNACKTATHSIFTESGDGGCTKTQINYTLIIKTF